MVHESNRLHGEMIKTPLLKTSCEKEINGKKDY